jgi:acyl-CoA oxidase
MEQFSKYLENKHPQNYLESAELLSNVIKNNFLGLTEFKTNPKKFFDFHELIVQKPGLEGFGIKFTVQYNLFAGTILQLGTKKQINKLKEIQKNGELGCFIMTEYSAGVMSGFRIDTEFKKDNNNYIITTTNINQNNIFESENKKTWISQGLTAKYGLIIARYSLDKSKMGVFLVTLDKPGVYRQDMGEKTGLNELDNAEFV